MATIEQLERKILELERRLDVQAEEANRLMSKSDKVLEVAKRAYKVDGCGYVQQWDPNTQNYYRTNMRIHTPEVCDGSVTNKKLAKESVTYDKLAADVQNRIGASLQNVALAPAVVNRGEESQVTVEASCYYKADKIILKRNGMDIAVGSGVSLTFVDTITALDTADIVYTAEFVRGTEKSIFTRVLYVAQPIYYGAGQTYQDAVNVSPSHISPVGEYPINVTADGSHIFILVPSNMTINHVEMNGCPVDLDEPTLVMLGGYQYLAYQSSDTYLQSSDTIVIS